MLEISVAYQLDDEDKKRLEALLPFYTDYIDEKGERPFADWDIERVFESIMCLGCRRDIEERLEFEERRQAAVKQAERRKEEQ